MAQIDPKLAGGFKDYLPEDMIPRQGLFDTIRSTFECFGFVPLDTPCVERADVLTGGDPEFKKQIYFVSQAGGEKEELALRFDLTVPLARVVAAYGDALPKPFRRYQIGRLWRGERQQAGRYREFAQCDADIVGTKDMRADAEIIALMGALMQNLGFKKFCVRVNNRKILNGLSTYADFDVEKTNGVIRILDKLDKQGWSDIQKDLQDTLALSKKSIDALKTFIEAKKKNQEDTLRAYESLFKGIEIAEEGITELREIMDSLDAMRVGRNIWDFDPTVARGLGYYTGPVFETILLDAKEIGSVFSGGRYDDLVGRFGVQSIPAVGASLGIDRLFAAMEMLGKTSTKKSVVQALVLDFEPNAKKIGLAALSELRAKGIASALYLGKETTLKGQLSFAVKEDIPFAILIGSSEIEKGVVCIKDLRAREQCEVPLSKCADTVSKKLTN